MEMVKKYQADGWNMTEELDWYFNPETGMLMKIVDGVAKGIAHFFATIKPVMTQISDPKLAADQLAVIGTAVQMLGDVTGPLIKVMKMVKKYQADGWTLTEEIAWYFNPKDGMLIKIVDGVATGIALFFKKIKTVTDGITDPSAMAKKMEVVSKGVAVGGMLLEQLSKVMAETKKYQAEGWSMTEELNWMFKVPDGMLLMIVEGMGEGIGILMNKILAVTATITNPAKAAKQVEVLAKIMEVVGTFSSAIESMGAMAVPGKGKSKTVVDVVNMVGSMSGAIAEGMGKLVPGLMAVITGSGSGMTQLYKYRHSIATLGVLLCAVGQFATAIETMQNIGKGGGGAEKVLKSMGDMFEPGKGVATIALKNIIDSMMALPLKDLPKESGPRLKNIVEVISAMDGLTAKKVTTITETIEAVKGLLASAGDDEIKGVVNLANVLAKPGKQTLTLKTVTPHIKATFVVNIDSKKLGEAVAAEGGVVASGDGSK